MRRLLLSILAAVFILSYPGLSVSEIKEGSFEIEPFAGGYLLNHQGDKAGFGLRGGYNVTKNWGLEGAYDYAGSRAQFFHADLLYHFIPDKAFNPFIFVGVGDAHMKPANDSYNKILGEIGIGFKYSLSNNIAIRVDVRDVQEKYNHVVTTAGLVFTFGGKSPKYVQTAAPEPKLEPKPEPKSEPKPELKPEPRAAEKVILLASEPKVEEKVAILASEPIVEEKIVILALEDVHFDFDKSTLTKEAQVILKRNIEILKANPKVKVRVAGYTSASGTDTYNQRLSERRANAVEEYLTKEGVIAPDRLSKIGYGETKPAMYEAAPKDLYSVAAKANMRVLFEIIVK